MRSDDPTHIKVADASLVCDHCGEVREIVYLTPRPLTELEAEVNTFVDQHRDCVKTAADAATA